MARAPAQSQHAGQPGSGRQGGGHPRCQPSKLWPPSDRSQAAPAGRGRQRRASAKEPAAPGPAPGVQKAVRDDHRLGVPQGGVISPLLSNIMLHEFDAWMERNYLNKKVRRSEEHTSELQSLMRISY